MSDVVTWLRMGDADRERYGGPEWVPFDIGALFDAPARELEAYEAATGVAMFLVLTEFATHGARATRAALWIARRRAGVTGERWDDFDPRPLQVVRRLRPPGEDDDVDDAPDGAAGGLGNPPAGTAGPHAASPGGSADAP